MDSVLEEIARARAPARFQYAGAFARNLGLVSEDEQACLRRACVGLPGLGGVGGSHLQALARLGIGAFHLADPDYFELPNFNRQLGATLATVGRSKVEVLAELAAEINPEVRTRSFSTGLDDSNLAAFLAGVDVVVDGIEFFRIEVRRMLYSACRQKGIPVVNAGPIGYGAAVQVFLPEGISFDEYFGLNDAMTRAQQLLAFGLGLGPGLAGDVDSRYVDFEAEKGPALISGCMLCSAVAATEVLKLATGRGKPAAAPDGLYFDPFRGEVRPLRPQAALTSSLEGMQKMETCFARFPALRAMHERELAARQSATPECCTAQACL